MSKTVIVTGASGNLGKAVVEKLIREGYTVVVTVRPGTAGGSYEDRSGVDIYTVDLTDEPAVAEFVAKVTQKHSVIRAALLLAGGYAPGNIHDTTGEAIKKMYTLNFETVYFAARPIFNQMIKQNHGSIIMVGSRPALQAADGKNSLPYALAKSLVFKLAEILNEEGAAHNITTTVMVPGIIDTPENRKAMPKADFSAWVTPEAIADTMVFVLSGSGSTLREPVLKVYGRS